MSTRDVVATDLNARLVRINRRPLAHFVNMVGQVAVTSWAEISQARNQLYVDGAVTAVRSEILTALQAGLVKASVYFHPRAPLREANIRQDLSVDFVFQDDYGGSKNINAEIVGPDLAIGE